jgi:heme-degrading monooxygenase HmoA
MFRPSTTGVTVFQLVVSHRVEDYDRFKEVFDAQPPARGGAVSHTIGRDLDEPDLIIIVATFTSAEQAIAWRDHPELRDAIGRAGIVGEPTVGVFEVVDAIGHGAT